MLYPGGLVPLFRCRSLLRFSIRILEKIKALAIQNFRSSTEPWIFKQTTMQIGSHAILEFQLNGNVVFLLVHDFYLHICLLLQTATSVVCIQV